MEAYIWPRDRKPQYTKYYLNIYFEGHCNKSHQSKNDGLQDTALKRADKTLKYFKGSLQAKILLILTKSWAGQSSYTHLIISFRRATSNTHHGKSQIIQIHSLLLE